MAKTYFQLLEYLTPKQLGKYSQYKMDPVAREHTDHFFGKDNDVVHEDLAEHEPHQKSEVHKAIERHLNQDIHPADYKLGLATDKYGRKTRIGRMIKDPALKQQYDTDKDRIGAKMGAHSGFKVSIHRGVQVAGQTNSSPDEKHPEGHSWGNESCKNADDGVMSGALKHEIKHGTVAMFVHDHSGKEVYRATLQPHVHEDDTKLNRNDEHVVKKGAKLPRVYALNSEYGVKNPAFTNHARDVAARLSANAPVINKQGNIINYHIHNKVYNDSVNDTITNPNLKPEHIKHILTWGSNKDKNVLLESKNKNVTAEHLDEMEKSSRTAEDFHGKAYKKIKPGVDAGMKHWQAADFRGHIAAHPNASVETIHNVATIPHKSIMPKPDRYDHHMSQIHYNVMENPNTSQKTLDHISDSIRKGATNASHLANLMDHPNGGTYNHFKKVFDHPLLHDPKMRDHHDERYHLQNIIGRLVNHPKAPKDLIDKVMNSPHPGTRVKAARHSNISAEHVDSLINHAVKLQDSKNSTHKGLARDALHVAFSRQSPNITSENIHRALKLKNVHTAMIALKHYKTDMTHVEAARKHPDARRYKSEIDAVEKRIKNGWQEGHRKENTPPHHSEDFDNDPF